MNKISINLLPVELRADTKKESQKRLIISLSISVLVGLVLVTSIVLGYRFFQSIQNQRLAQETTDNRDKISSLKNKEELAFLLKSRLTKISSLAAEESKSVLGFNLITFLIPEGIQINSFSIDKKGEIALAGETDSLASLNEFFDNLVDPKKNEGKIASTKLVSLNKTGERIRFEMLIAAEINKNLSQVK